MQTWFEILNSEGKIFCKEKYISSTDVENYQQFKNWINLTDKSLDNVRYVRKCLFNKYLKEWKIWLIKDVLELIIYLSNRFELSIVSNSEEYLIKSILESHNIEKDFENIFGIKKNILPKPSSELYLFALRSLNIDKKKVFAIEDSISWLQSAIDSSIKCYWISDKEKVWTFCIENNIKLFKNMKDFLQYLCNNII